MSNQYEKCDFCGETVQVSCTNADYDFGCRRLGNRLICKECRDKIKGDEDE